jgi:GNAT superfamily N-acetyltransferase
MQYRLSNCSSYCLGLCVTAEASDLATFATARPIDSNDPLRKSVLIAHIVASKTTNCRLQNEDLDIPHDPPRDNETRGHKEHGDTIVIHSMNVIPQYRRVGVGTLLLKEYCARMAASQSALVIAAYAHSKIFLFYQSVGLRRVRSSTVLQFGEEWTELRMSLVS